MKIEEYLQQLPERTKKNLEMDITSRINFIKQEKFIRHSKYIKINKLLENLYTEPLKERYRSILLVGDSDMGKTVMVKDFAKSKIIKDEETQTFIEGVMYIRTPNKADLHDLYNRIFQFFVVPYRRDEPVSERENKIKHYCEINSVKMIVIDEIQGALIGSIAKQMEFMNGIKNLSAFLKIPIVMVGVPKAVSLVRSDHQLISRFIPIKIKNWEMDENYISLLYAIEMTLPLRKPSSIYKDEKLALDILEMSNGLTGGIITICNSLAIKAIKNGKERIERKMLRDIEYISASNNKKRIYADEI